MKKVAIIGSVGIPANYGGFETLVEYLTKSLSDDVQLTVYCSSKAYPEKRAMHNGAQLKYVPLNANGIQSIPYDIWSIVKAIRKHDTLLILGVAGCFTIPWFKFFFKRRFVINVDGTEWKRDKWGKFAKWYLKRSEKLAAKYADALVADNPVIKTHMDSTYGINSVYIPYGGDHVTSQPMTAELQQKYPTTQRAYAFKVCRIEPENNIHMVLEAFSQQDNLPLIIVGNWQYSDYGKDLYNRYSTAANICLLDPIYDQNELNALRGNCALYVHGHSAGGTNPSLVEAMALGVNVVAFDVDYNRATMQNEGAYFSDGTTLLEFIKGFNAHEHKYGDALKRVADETYNWQKIAMKYAELF